MHSAITSVGECNFLTSRKGATSALAKVIQPPWPALHPEITVMLIDVSTFIIFHNSCQRISHTGNTMTRSASSTNQDAISPHSYPYEASHTSSRNCVEITRKNRVQRSCNDGFSRTTHTSYSNNVNACT